MASHGRVNNNNNNYNTYWKLPVYQNMLIKAIRVVLEQKRYAHPGTAKRDRYIQMLHRSERGLPSYEHLKKSALMNLIQERRLAIVGTEGDRKQDLIDKLEAADESRQFTRLMDLPAELRNRVYYYYVHGFRTMRLDAPAQPPLSKISRTVRQEVLPIFYRECTFEIPSLRRDGCFHIEHPTLLFLNVLPAEYIAHIVKLAFKFNCYAVGINFDRGRHSISSSPRIAEFQSRGQSLYDSMRQHFEKLVERPGVGKLRKEDIYELRRLAEVGY